MATVGPRRGKITRFTAQRLGNVGTSELLGRLRSRGVLSRVLICLVGVTLSVIATQAWRPPFPYRLHYRPTRDIRVRVPFSLVDEFATQRRRAEAAENVPLIFINDPQPLRELPGRLEDQLSVVAATQRLEQLSSPLRQAFGFEIPQTAPTSETKSKPTLPANSTGAQTATSPPQSTTSMRQQFQTFRDTVNDPDKRQSIRVAVDQALAPLVERGLLDKLPQQPSQTSATADVISVRHADDPSRRIPRVSLAEVLLDVQSDPAGPFMQRLRQQQLDPALAERVFTWLAHHFREIRKTLTYDARATQLAREEAANQQEPVIEFHKPGEPGALVEGGSPIDENQLKKLRREHEEYAAQLGSLDRIRRILAVTGLVIVLYFLCGVHIVRNEPQVAASVGRLSVLLAVSVATVAASRALSFEPLYAEVVPLVLTVMMLAIAYSREFGLLIAFALSLITTQSTGGDLERFMVLMGATATAVLTLGRVRSRTKLISVGFYAGLACFGLSWGTGVLTEQTPKFLLLESFRGLAWGLVSGFVISGTLPFVERMFGVVTDISLLELGDVSHPLLQELVRRAPGTYNHSVAVATLAERAAERIGANALLVRVGAYFHDIGKMLKPHYFVENQSDDVNRHEHLAPAMSTLIIIGHVKDGADLAREHHLPQPMIDFIEQHHGTTLVEYFYHGATQRRHQQPDYHNDVEESAFRYPGPKPQTKEAGILMLADCVESASRTLSEPTPARIESLVHELTMKRLLDRQFDESGLDLQEIRAIEDSLIKSLTAVYHGRIKYPEQRTA